MRTHYEVLEVSPRASVEIITAAYLHLAQLWDPSRNPENRKAAAEKLAEVSTAFAVLSDSDARAQYDDSISAAAPSEPPTRTPPPLPPASWTPSPASLSAPERVLPSRVSAERGAPAGWKIVVPWTLGLMVAAYFLPSNQLDTPAYAQLTVPVALVLLAGLVGWLVGLPFTLYRRRGTPSMRVALWTATVVVGLAFVGQLDMRNGYIAAPKQPPTDAAPPANSEWDRVADDWERRHAEWLQRPGNVEMMQAALNTVHEQSPHLAPAESLEEAYRRVLALQGYEPRFPGIPVEEDQ